MHEPTNHGPQPTAFKRFLTRASVIVKQPRRLQSLLAQVSKKIARISNKRIAGFKADVELLACLVKDFIAGRYRDISPQALITIVGGLLYFVVPLDAMPDFLFGWGLLDDGAVIADCLESDGKIKYAAVSYPHTSEWVVPEKLTLTPQDCSRKARYISDYSGMSDASCVCNTFKLDIIVDGDSDKLGFGDSRTTISYQSSEPIGTTEYTQSSSYEAPIKAITTNYCTMKIDCKANKNDCAGKGVPSGDA